MSVGLAAALRQTAQSAAADGRIAVYRWKLSLDAVAPEDAARHVAAAYLNSKSQWQHPDARLAPRLPPQGSSRKGDFGEIIAATLYSQRLGRTVPFQKLQLKPVGGATLQGTDVLALTITHGDDPVPAIVEVKARSSATPSGVLPAISASLNRTSDDYLESAWAAGVALMEAHPDFEKAYALSAAQHLARLLDPDGSYPPHERHAVVVAPSDTLTIAKVNEYWATDPPVTELHVVVIENMDEAMDRLYAVAGELTYGDVASAAPHLLGPKAHTPGLSAPVSSAEAARFALGPGGRDSRLVVEAALWLLADWDGMGIARARVAENTESDSLLSGLSSILVGAIGRAEQTLKDSELAPVAALVRRAWERNIAARDLVGESQKVAAAIAAPDLAEAARYVLAAVAHRLPRHPATMTEAAGATGANTAHVVERMERFGRHALWPSQAAALAGGLLDRGHPSLAVKMPTSAGKTALIELLVADTLDGDGDPVVAVLAPTKALVAQLTSDLRRALPDGVAIRSSHGGLDFDTEDLAGVGVLAERGAAVMTPERFDLEWRRAATGDAAANVDKLQLLVIDEAHLMNEASRGARLELAIARALRRGVRVVLLSSQFPNTSQLASWLGGRSIESEWSPTWLRRFVYYRTADKQTGLLQAEVGPPKAALALKPSAKSKQAGCPRERPAEAAALAEAEHPDGLVVVYTNEKARFPKLVEQVASTLGPWAARSGDLVALADRILRVDPAAAELLRDGIGVHHGDVPRLVRQTVESAARRNLLRCVVCTPTLLEGVDFPTRTVIAAYPPKDRNGRPEVARLRNLAGRAGRGGRFTSGTLVVMAGDATQAKRWLKAFRDRLPVTKSALAVSLEFLRRHAQSLDLLELADGQGLSSDPIDGLVLAAIAEGAVTDGDLRAALEEALGRTLWYASTPPSVRNYVLEIATGRASHVARAVGGGPWSRAFYRSGLPVASCVAVRDALGPQVPAFIQAMDTPNSSPDEWLLRLATDVAPAASELASWADLDRAELQATLASWLAGDPLEDIESAHGQAWDVIGPGLETLLPWVLTGAVEFGAALASRPELREVAHRRLGISRLRYGVPRTELCELVRRGYDRTLVTGIAAEYDRDPRSFFQSLTDYVTEKASTDLEALDEEPF